MGDAELILGDCRSVLPTLAPGSVAAVVTDPPYGIDTEGDGYGRRQNYGKTGRRIEGDGDLSIVAEVLPEFSRVLRDDAWLALFCSPNRRDELAAILAGHGLNVFGEIVWDKAAPGLGPDVRYQHETIVLCRRGNPKRHGSIISVSRHHLSHARRHERHPHEKPVRLVADLVRFTSASSETVLDPFMGSGKTGVACARLGRRFIGVEIDPHWYSHAQAAILHAPGQTARQPSLFATEASA